MTDYVALASGCRTENQFNRLHIDLDATLAPMEIAAIYKAAQVEGFPAAGHAWLDVVAAQSPTLFREPQPFVREQLHEHVVFFRGTTERRRQKRLLIAFTGVARRLMIPTAAFLQALDARDRDVVLIKHAGSFLEGAEGVAGDLDGLVSFVRRKVGFWAYGSIAVFGVSSGGGPAILTARKIGANRGVSMCGASGDRLLGHPARPYLWARLMRRRTELCYVHGVENDPDRAAATAMHATWGGTLRPVDGVRSHNVMGSLLKRGLLKDFLGEVL